MRERRDQPYLSGRVVGDDGEPLAGVGVRLTWNSMLFSMDVEGDVAVDRPERSLVTGDDGVFAFPEWVFRDPSHDDCDDDDWEADEGDEDWGDDSRDRPWTLVLRRGNGYAICQDIDILDGPVDLGDVAFCPAALRRFQVVADDDSTISGGRLSAVFYARPPHEGKVWTLALDDRGTARVPLFDESVESVLMWTLHHADYPAKHGRVLEWRGPEAEPLVLVVQRGCRVSGRVVDEEGQPAADVFVKLLAEPMATTDLASVWSAPRTGEDGRFELTGVDTGGAAIQLFDGGVRGTSANEAEAALASFKSGGAPLARVQVPASQDGSDIDLGDIRITRPGTEAHEAETGELHLQVLDRDGTPLESAIVSVHPNPVPMGVGFTGRPSDPEGCVTFSELAPGTYGAHVHATVDGIECFRGVDDLQPGPEQIDIVVTGAGHVRIELAAAEAPDTRTVFRQIHVEDPNNPFGGFESKGDHIVHRSEPGCATDLTIRAMGREPVILRGVDALSDRPTRVRAVLSRSS